MVENLPAGEAACGIDDGTGDGTLVVDGSWPGLGLLTSPLTMHYEAGAIVAVEGERASATAPARSASQNSGSA